MENEKLTKTDEKSISVKLDYAIIDKVQLAKRQEQKRTVIKKRLFLKTLLKTGGVITECCEQAEICRAQYYTWKNNDPLFAKAIEAVNNQKNEIAEDLLWGLVTMKKDAPSIRYYLDRRHPLYKPKNETEVVVGDRTLEDIIDEDEEKLNIKPKKDIKQIENDGTNNKDKQISDRKVIEDKNEEGGKGAVQVQHGAVVVLGKENEEKPNTESEAKGAK